MSLNLLVSILGEEGTPRRPLWVPNVKQPVSAVRRVIEAMFKSDGEALGRNRKRKGSKSSSLRLFFNGHELEDGFSMEQYDLAEGNVIQVQRPTVKAAASEKCSSPLLDDQNQQHQKTSKQETSQLTSDLYYCLGEHVEALDDETGAWFPATIAAIIQGDDDSVSNSYLVTFRRPSLGGRVPRRLAQLRPPSWKALDCFEELLPGQAVLVLLEPSRLWQVGLIEQTIRDLRCSKKKAAAGGGKVVLSLVMATSTQGEGGGTVLQQYVHQFKAGSLFELQSNVPRAQRSPELAEVLRSGLPPGSRFYQPDCPACSDDPTVEHCPSCGCSVCSLKTRPEVQLLCDECDRPTHIDCLQSPLSEVPNDEQDEDWYCDQCRTETAEEVRRRQREHLKKKKKDEGNPNGNWGFGMSTASSSAVSASSKPQDTPKFGAIEGVPVGAWWRFRVQASAAGVHRPLVAGVDGSLQAGGVYSIVFSGAHSVDVDRGEELFYSLAAGKPSSAWQSRALALNQSGGRPVRVLRGGNGRSGQKRTPYLPKVGVRYDGLYRVVGCWREEQEDTAVIWRFHLKRDDPEPAPWTEAGRYRARKAGFQVPRYPEGWTVEMAGKRRLTLDLKMVKRMKRRDLSLEKRMSTGVSAWSIPGEVEELIEQDKSTAIQKQWTEFRQLAREKGKEAFFSRLAETFACAVCLDLALEPVILSACDHLLCRRCFGRLLEEVTLADSCPVCRTEEPLATAATENHILGQILGLLLAASKE